MSENLDKIESSSEATHSGDGRLRHLLLLLLWLLLGGGFLVATTSEATLSTVALWSALCIFGTALCNRFAKKLDDPSLSLLADFWLLKLAMTLFLLHAGWIPGLEPGSDYWGYDPQRYYLQAQTLVDSNWDASQINLNYPGVLYYYGVIFYVLGHNPFIPALVNCFVSLLAALYLIKAGHEIKGMPHSGGWILALVLLIPEMLWFDILTARETVLANLLSVLLLLTGLHLVNRARSSIFSFLLKASVLASLIIVLRGSMILPVIIAIGIMVWVFSFRSWTSKAALILLLGAVAAVTPLIIDAIGGYEFNFADIGRQLTNVSENVASTGDMQWSDKSIGQLLLPHNVWESIAFLPFRMILYLIAPAPAIAVSFDKLWGGDWGEWQHLFSGASALLYIITFPFLLAGMLHAIKNRSRNMAPLIMYISFWCVFIAIAYGNLIIHERYRIMCLPLFWGCVWLSVTACKWQLLAKMSFLWYGFLALCAIFYVVYKGML